MALQSTISSSPKIVFVTSSTIGNTAKPPSTPSGTSDTVGCGTTPNDAKQLSQRSFAVNPSITWVPTSVSGGSSAAKVVVSETPSVLKERPRLYKPFAPLFHQVPPVTWSDRVRVVYRNKSVPNSKVLRPLSKNSQPSKRPTSSNLLVSRKTLDASIKRTLGRLKQLPVTMDESMDCSNFNSLVCQDYGYNDHR